MKTLPQIEKISLWIFKGLSALILAFTLASIGEAFIKYGLFSFLFIILSVTTGFLYFIKDFKWLRLCLVNAVLLLLAILLRLYVVLASG